MPENSHYKKASVIGAFDDIQTKDIRFLHEVNQRYGQVHVELFSDELIEKISGKPPKFQLDERKYYLESIRYVTRVGTTRQERPAISHEDNHLWVFTQQQALKGMINDLQAQGVDFSIIPDSELEGFPPSKIDHWTLSPSKKVMVSGCFDWVHTGHIRFFEEVSQFGDLYVVVGHDENLRLLKGEGHPLFPQDERLYWVQSIRFVTQAMISTGHGWLDAEPEVLKIKPDIFVVNEDGDRPEKQAFFTSLGIAYKVLERKPKPGLPRRVSTELRGF
jgi:cytidyltransferase-like protein